ncbi:MAG TPA: hypothetical protein VHA52_02065 [Candidatus Babeliaceae bacterium]|nr:hypothetical protein [Candidatus Babeliaceae bacterium]HVZ98041.1 hypothetical protein [Chitinophagaceae bacterium]
MKQTIKTTRILVIGLFSLCAITFTNAAFAGVKDTTPAELKFIGKIDNHPVFELKLNNPEKAEYYVTIKDADNNTLYSETLKGSNLTRKYSIDVDDAELHSPSFGLRVEVTSAETHKTEVYKVSAHTSVTENIIVAKS